MSLGFRIAVVGLILVASVLVLRGAATRGQDHLLAIIKQQCAAPDEACWRQLVDQALTKNLSSGFEIVKTLYENYPTFRPLCNGMISGLVDVNLYGRNPDWRYLSYTPDTTLCNFAFYQQYPMNLLLATKNPQEAKAFCDAVGKRLDSQVPGTEAECYRGIGRGLPFIDAASLGNPPKMASFAVENCKSLASNETDYDICLSGVFNQIATAEANRQYGLSVDTADPTSLCKLQTGEAAPRCIGSMKVSAISLIDEHDPAAALKRLQQIYGAGYSREAAEIMKKIGYDRAQRSLSQGAAAYPAEIDIASSLTAAYQTDYVSGFALGLVKNSLPGAQHVVLEHYCSEAVAALPSIKVIDCLYIPVEFMRGAYAPTAFAAACSDIANTFGVTCAAMDALSAQDGSYF